MSKFRPYEVVQQLVLTGQISALQFRGSKLQFSQDMNVDENMHVEIENRLSKSIASDSLVGIMTFRILRTLLKIARWEMIGGVEESWHAIMSSGNSNSNKRFYCLLERGVCDNQRQQPLFQPGRWPSQNLRLLSPQHIGWIG